VAPEKSSSQKAAAVVSDLVQAWVDEVQRFYDNLGTKPNGFAPEDALSETKQSLDRLRPALAKAIDLNLELLRPWSIAFTPQGDEDA